MNQKACYNERRKGDEMDRLELVRVEVDRLISKLQNEEDRKFAYLHLYGVAQFAAMLAINKNVSTEICGIAAMLHDISMYALNSGRKNHADKSAEYAKELLENLKVFKEEEILIITNAISKHSNKLSKSDGIYAEILKDADVLAHYLYNTQIPVPEGDKVRLFYLLEYVKNVRTK